MDNNNCLIFLTFFLFLCIYIQIILLYYIYKEMSFWSGKMINYKQNMDISYREEPYVKENRFIGRKQKHIELPIFEQQ